MIKGGAIKLIVKMLESQDDNVRWTATRAVGGMVKHGAISLPYAIVELTNSIEHFQGAMIEADAIKLVVKMLESQDNNVRWSAVRAVRKMAEHGATNQPCMIVELTDLTQKNSGMP
jgi:HEAT repeat protein